ncbi:MAG: ATP-binding cassette domain-containing protein, partial [Microcystis sp.]|uniref:ATP-binding cassette domain-containing protein n=1 Tax=Microcystis sp. TaxID=1127 RepID=UPI003918A1C9
MLEISDLSVNYGGIKALQQVSLRVEPGEIVTLIGANGAGKTTTLKTISRILTVKTGRIIYQGQDITHL